MPEPAAKRTPTDRTSIPRVPATSQDEAGVRVREQQDAIRLQLISRSGRYEQLASEIAKFMKRESQLSPTEGAERDGLSIFATGPLEFWLLANGGSAAAVTALQACVAESASTFDQSDSRLTFVLSGRHALDVLAKATTLDLGSRTFPTPGAAHSMIAHIPALIVQRPDAYEILVPRSYASSFVAWLEEAAMEYGYAAAASQRPSEAGR